MTYYNQCLKWLYVLICTRKKVEFSLGNNCNL